VVEAPDTADDCEEPTLMPPVNVDENPDELTEDSEFVPTNVEEPVEENKAVFVVPVAVVTVSPDVLSDDNKEPELVPKELLKLVPMEFVTGAPGELTEDTEEAAYVPVEVVITGPDEETPDILIDDTDDPVITPEELTDV
jgi:hypothetical protein